MALSNQIDLDLEMELDTESLNETSPIVANRIIYGVALGALAGAAIVGLGPVPPLGGLDQLVNTVTGRALLVLAGVGAGGAVGALSGLIRGAGRDLTARRTDRALV